MRVNNQRQPAGTSAGAVWFTLVKKYKTEYRNMYRAEEPDVRKERHHHRWFSAQSWK